MKKITIQLMMILVIISTGSVFAQEPGISWTKLYKPVGLMGTPSMAQAYDGQQLPDGGYLAAGVTVNPYLKGYLVRTNTSGDTIWTRQYFNDLANYGDFTCTDVEIANDGNYFLCGYGTKLATTGIWLLKVNTSGDLMWSRYFTKGSADTVFVTHNMKVTPDGGVIIIGSVKQDLTTTLNMFILKYTADGTFEWYKKFGNPDLVEEGLSIENAWDGGYLLCSKYDSIGGIYYTRLRLLKTDISGQQQWSVIYQTEPYDIGDFHCLKRTTDNNYVITGGVDEGDCYLMKVDQAGNTIWYHTYGLTNHGRSFDWVAQTGDGGFIMTGYGTPEGESDPLIYIVKTNNDGTTEEWSKSIDIHFNDRAFVIHPTLDNGYLIYGMTRLNPDSTDYLLMIKLGGSNAINDPENIKGSIVVRNYPNPFSLKTTIQYSIPVNTYVSIKVFDLIGNEIMKLVNKEQIAGSYTMQVSTNDLPPGIYYCRLTAGEISATNKMIVVR